MGPVSALYHGEDYLFNFFIFAASLVCLNKMINLMDGQNAIIMVSPWKVISIQLFLSGHNDAAKHHNAWEGGED